MTPGTLVTEYTWLEPWHGLVVPLMVPGWRGTAVFTVTDNVEAGPFPQVLLGTTIMEPLALPTVTVMLYVPCPRRLVHRGGTVQL